MDKDKIQELLETRALAEQELERMRSAMTVMFTDIKGSTAYFEKKGDVEGMAMINRHNALLFPIVQSVGGRVIKTIGDSILAHFSDQMAAVKAAVAMQRALAKDREGRPELEQIHIRIGVHTGLGLIKENDLYGDVVNAAAKVQHQCEPDQILITDVLLDAAQEAGYECARMGRAELRGKDEPIELYAVAWSEAAAQQLIEEVQSQYERKLKDARRLQTELEEELESARENWRSERRNLNSEIERLEEAVEEAREGAREQLHHDLQSEIRFQLEEAVRAQHQAQQDLAAAQKTWEEERTILRAQIQSMQMSVIEAMERSNNPARQALAIREQVDARVNEAKEDWNLQWEGDRKRLNAEIERLRKASGAADEKKEAARRAMLEKLGKLPPGSSPGIKTAAQWEQEFSDARIKWETERDQLLLKIKKLEHEGQQSKDAIRTAIFQELRGQYEPRLADVNRECKRLEQELQTASNHFQDERGRLTAKIEQLERALPEAQDAARRQTAAELNTQFETKIEELNRIRSRSERKHADALEEWEMEHRRARKQIAALEEQLKEARDNAFKAQRNSRTTPEMD